MFILAWILGFESSNFRLFIIQWGSCFSHNQNSQNIKIRSIHCIPTKFSHFSMNGHCLNLQWATQHRFWVVNTFWIFFNVFWYWITQNFYVIHSLIFPSFLAAFLLFSLRNIYETINIVLWFPLVQKKVFFLCIDNTKHLLSWEIDLILKLEILLTAFSPMRVSNS